MKNHSILLLAIGEPTTDRRTQNFKHSFEHEGWEVETLSVPTVARRGPRRFWEYHRQLGKAVRSRSIDVVLAGDLYSLSAAVWMKRSGRSKRVIYDAREVYTELPRVASRGMVKRVWRALERRGLMHCDLVVVTAPRDVQAICDVHNFLPRPVLVRNLPMREDILEADSTVRQSVGIASGAPVAVYVGGLQAGRGLKPLVEAFRELPGVHLLLIGDGALRKELESEAPANVHFTGAIPSAEALRIVAACDAGVALVEPISRSYELALPSKLFEYMMCSIPVVSSRLEHVMDLFGQEDWITFVDEKSSESIRHGVYSALQKAGESSLRQRARSLALSEYHFEHDASDLLKILTAWLDA